MIRRALVALLHTIAKAIVAPILVLLGLGIIGAVLGHVFSFGLATAVGIGALVVLAHPPRLSDIVQLLRTQTPRLIRFGFPLYMGTLISNVLAQVRLALLPWFVPDAVIGNYQVAHQFIALITVFTGALAVTLYPSFSKFSYISAPQLTRQAYRVALRYSSFVVIPFTSLLIVIAQPMIATLYVTQYSFAALYFVLMVLPILFIGLGFVVAPAFLTSQGDTRGVATLFILRSVIGLALAPIGLYLNGVIGFIAANILASTIGITYTVNRVHQQFQVGPELRFLVKLVLSTLGATALAFGLGRLSAGIPPIGVLALSAVIYVILVILFLPITGALVPDDLQNLERFTIQFRPLRPVIRGFIHIEAWLIQRVHTRLTRD